jgi:aldehyde dehydrogenase (NAD+)
MDKKTALDILGIKEVNSGATCGGTNGWMDTTGPELVSYSPIDGKPIAAVKTAGRKEYEAIVAGACEAFKTFRMMPAPERGQMVREIGEALREKKEALGYLVSLEVGKIIAEGQGEVQEMIDIADFAVGLSRQLYGLTMHSERPSHRMYEQWHPLGIVGVITAFNFPVAVWSWNTLLATVCGDPVLFKPSSDPADGHRHHEHRGPCSGQVRGAGDFQHDHRQPGRGGKPACSKTSAFL